MKEYRDKNTRQLYDMLVASIGLQLRGKDNSEELKKLKEEADRRDKNLYDLSFDRAIKDYKVLPFPKEKTEEQTSRSIVTLKHALDGSELRLAKVYGDSMVNENIKTGDYVLYESGRTPANWEIIVAKYKEQTFIKKYIRKGEQITLISANKDYEDIKIKEQDKFEILGVVKIIIKEI